MLPLESLIFLSHVDCRKLQRLTNHHDYSFRDHLRGATACSATSRAVCVCVSVCMSTCMCAHACVYVCMRACGVLMCACIFGYVWVDILHQPLPSRKARKVTMEEHNQTLYSSRATDGCCCGGWCSSPFPLIHINEALLQAIYLPLSSVTHFLPLSVLPQ